MRIGAASPLSRMLTILLWATLSISVQAQSSGQPGSNTPAAISPQKYVTVIYVSINRMDAATSREFMLYLMNSVSQFLAAHGQDYAEMANQLDPKLCAWPISCEQEYKMWNHTRLCIVQQSAATTKALRKHLDEAIARYNEQMQQEKKVPAFRYELQLVDLPKRNEEK